MLTLVLWGGGGLALLLLVAGVYVTVSSERSLVEERLGRYLEEPADELDAVGVDDEDASGLTNWLNAQVTRSSFGEGIAKDLARADLKLKPAEYLGLVLLSAIVTSNSPCCERTSGAFWVKALLLSPDLVNVL